MWKEIALVTVGFIGGVGASVITYSIAESLHEIRVGLSHMRDSIGSLAASHHNLQKELKDHTEKVTAKLSELPQVVTLEAPTEPDPEVEEEDSGMNRSV